jgi:hypothetical protein
VNRFAGLRREKEWGQTYLYGGTRAVLAWKNMEEGAWGMERTGSSSPGLEAFSLAARDWASFVSWFFFLGGLSQRLGLLKCENGGGGFTVGSRAGRSGA